MAPSPTASPTTLAARQFHRRQAISLCEAKYHLPQGKYNCDSNITAGGNITLRSKISLVSPSPTASLCNNANGNKTGRRLKVAVPYDCKTICIADKKSDFNFVQKLFVVLAEFFRNYYVVVVYEIFHFVYREIIDLSHRRHKYGEKRHR